MPDLDDRFGALRGTRGPDLWPDIQRREPRDELPTGPGPGRRVAIVLLALAVAVAGIGFAIRAFDRGGAVPVGTPPPSPVPARAGSIVFPLVDASTSQSRIAAMNPNGTGLRFLTTGHEDDPWARRYGFSSDGDPSWSPDGSTIAFVRRYSEGVDSLCEIAADGTGFRVVVRDLRGANIAWSPDGSTIAFYSERDGSIHLIDADGTHERVLTHRAEGANDDWPAWSPDGRWIAFTSKHLWVIRPNGSGLRRLTDAAGFASEPAWYSSTTVFYAWSPRNSVASSVRVTGLFGNGHSGRVSPPGRRAWSDPVVTPAGHWLLLGSDRQGRATGMFEHAPSGAMWRIGNVIPDGRPSWCPTG